MLYRSISKQSYFVFGWYVLNREVTFCTDLPRFIYSCLFVVPWDNNNCLIPAGYANISTGMQVHLLKQKNQLHNERPSVRYQHSNGRKQSCHKRRRWALGILICQCALESSCSCLDIIQCYIREMTAVQNPLCVYFCLLLLRDVMSRLQEDKSNVNTQSQWTKGTQLYSRLCAERQN